MTSHKHTHHSQLRQNQRQIDDETIDFVYSYGQSKRQKGGTEVITLQKSDYKKSVQSWLKGHSDKFIKKAMKVVLIMKGDVLITTYYQKG